MRYRRVLLACGALVVGSIPWLACISEDPGRLPSLGEDGGGCFNGGCQTGLQCVNGRCGPAPDAGPEVEASTGDGGSDAEGGPPCIPAPRWTPDGVPPLNPGETQVRCPGAPLLCDRKTGNGTCCGTYCVSEGDAASCLPPTNVNFCESAGQCNGTMRCCYGTTAAAFTPGRCTAHEDPSFDGTKCATTCPSGIELCRIGDPRACNGDAGRDGGCLPARLGNLTVGVCAK